MAKDWCDSFEVGPLARKSFELHEQLAKEFGNTDYRKLNTLSVTAKVTFSIQWEHLYELQIRRFPFLSGFALQPLQDYHFCWVVPNVRNLIRAKLWYENVGILFPLGCRKELGRNKRTFLIGWTVILLIHIY